MSRRSRRNGRHPVHRYSRQFERHRGAPALEEPPEAQVISGEELWEQAMEGRASDPDTLAAALAVLTALNEQLVMGILLVQDKRGAAGVLEAWEALDDEEDMLAFRAAILVMGERIRLLAETLGLDTTGWMT